MRFTFSARSARFVRLLQLDHDNSMWRVAEVQVHAPRGLWPIQNMGEPAVLYCFLFLYIAARGAGKFGVDRR